MVTWIAGVTGELGRVFLPGFLDRGDQVVGLGRSSQVAARDAPPRYRYLEGDLGSAEGAKGLAARAQEVFGPVDNLVITVGAWAGGQPLQHASHEQWAALMETNLTVPFRLIRAVLGTMVQRRHGCIVTVGALSAVDAAPDQAAYNAAKAALAALTRSVAAEGRRYGIAAMCLLPGTIDTAANRRAMPDADPAGWVDPHALLELALLVTGPHGAAMSGAALAVAGPPAGGR